MRVDRCSFLGVCLRPAATKTGAVVSALRRMVSPSFPRSGEVGGLVGEVVDSLVFCSDLASPAGRGGEGRRRWELLLWLLVVLLFFLVCAAPAGRGGEGSGRLKSGSGCSAPGGVVDGELQAFWRRIWRRRRFSQVRSSTKISSLVGERLMWRSLNLDGVFLAGREVAFLLLLRRRCRRSSGGWFEGFVGVEWVVCGCVGFSVCVLVPPLYV